MHACTHTHPCSTCTHAHARIHTHPQQYMYARAHACTYTHPSTCTHVHAHTRTHPSSTCMHTRARTPPPAVHVHTRARAHTHPHTSGTCTHACTHTHTHPSRICTHTCARTHPPQQYMYTCTHMHTHTESEVLGLCDAMRRPKLGKNYLVIFAHCSLCHSRGLMAEQVSVFRRACWLACPLLGPSWPHSLVSTTSLTGPSMSFKCSSSWWSTQSL